MKNKLYKLLVVILYLLSLFIFLFCVKVRINPSIYIYTRVRLILLILSCMFMYVASFILVKKLNYTKKILKINIIIYFIVYMLLVITLTLFDEIFGRNGLVLIKWNKDLFDMYIKTSFNIVPLKTIILFINGYINNYVTLRDFVINIFGNLVAFMPCGVLLPLMFKRINKYNKFLIMITIFVLIIEILQFMTLSGSCDIDDLILNVLGASIVYFVYNIKFVKGLINKIFLFE